MKKNKMNPLLIKRNTKMEIIQLLCYLGISLLCALFISLFFLITSYSTVFPYFSDQSTTNVKFEKLCMNDIEETEKEYKIVSRTDPYIAYSINKISGRAIRIAFNEPFETAGNIQLFWATEDEGFNQNASTVAYFGKGEKYVEFVVDVDDIIAIRLDVNAEIGMEFLVTDVEVDTRDKSVLDLFLNPCFWIVFVLILSISFIRERYTLNIDSRASRWIKVFIGWGIMICVVFSPVLFGDYKISTANFMYNVVPWNSMNVSTQGPWLSDSIDAAIPMLYETYMERAFSFWNDNIAFGMPVGIEMLINPLNWIYMLDWEYAFTLKSILEYSVAYFGTCFLLNKLKLSVVAQIMGAVTYSLSSAMVMWHYWPHTDVMMLVPWAFGVTILLIQDRKNKYALLLGLILYLMLIAEMPTYAAYAMYLLGVYVVCKTIYTYKKNWKLTVNVFFKFAMSVVIAVIGAFPYLLSLLSSVGSNGYAESRREQARYALDIESIRSLLLPFYSEGLSGHVNERVIYIGIVGLVLLGLLFHNYKKKKQTFWVCSLIVLLILIYSHVLDEIYVLLPVINTSSKSRLISLLMFVACIVISISFNDIIENIQCYISKWYLRLPIYLLGFGILYVVFAKSNEVTWEGITILCYCATLIWLECYINISFLREILKPILIGIVIINMSFYAQSYMALIDKDASTIPKATDSIEFLQENSNRIYTLTNWTLFPNTNVFYDINSITSHSFVNTNKDMKSYMTLIDSDVYTAKTALHGFKIDNVNLLKYAGVSHIASDVEIEDVELELIYDGEDGLNIYSLQEYNEIVFIANEIEYVENKELILEEMAMEYQNNKAYVYVEEGIAIKKEEEDTGESNATINLVEDTGDYIRINVSSESSELLVLNEYDDGNWKVYVDGNEQNILSVNYLFKGVEIDKGEHVVEFVYDTTVIVNLTIVSICTLVVTLFSAGFLIIKERRKNK